MTLEDLLMMGPHGQNQMPRRGPTDLYFPPQPVEGQSPWAPTITEDMSFLEQLLRTLFGERGF